MTARRKGHDPVHAFRAPIELVAEAKRIAESRGESIGDVIRAALRRYVARHRRPTFERGSESADYEEADRG